MLIVCWSVKGGSGTTVVAASLALLSASQGIDTCLVDLAGDAASCLGLADPLDPHEIAVGNNLGLLALSHRPCTSAHQWTTVSGHLGHSKRTVVVDAGLGEPDPALRAAAHHDLLVVRGCYLALRRAAVLQRRPSGVVLVNEPGRALRRQDVEAVTGAPVVSELAWDPTVARSVDAGLLASRVPRSLREGLGALSWTS
ncbi:MAG: hypothetical protein F2795_08115 [Actinobacteria bacterium]|uniref:Unannotated protein n=1 Tax=freshwater metagenome TaxID=449393 RepID=A0A6J7EN56_9ZZZZ|nr:hypothetical protein [Actinomycetota bacterium]